MSSITPAVLDYTETGSGSPMVLLPGGLTGYRGWDPLVPALSEHHRVLNVQTRANAEGESGNLGMEGYGAPIERESLALTLDELDLRTPVHLVGWSNGGRIALDFALAYPDRVATVTAIEPAAMWLLGDERTDVSEFLLFMQSVAGSDLSEDEVIRFLVDVGVAPAGTPFQALPQWPVWFDRRLSLSWHAADIDASIEGTLRISELAPPLLLIKGRDSAPMMRDTVDEISRRLPSATVVELQGTHACLLQSPQAFITELEAHVTRQMD